MRDPTDFALTTSPPDDDKHLYIRNFHPIASVSLVHCRCKKSHPQILLGLQVKSNRTYWTWNCIYQTLTLLRWPTAKGVKKLYYFKDVLKKQLKESSCLLLNTVDWKKTHAPLGTYKTLWKMGSLGYQQYHQEGISIRKKCLEGLQSWKRVSWSGWSVWEEMDEVWMSLKTLLYMAWGFPKL